MVISSEVDTGEMLGARWSRAIGLYVVLAFGLAGLLAACSSEGQSQLRDAAENVDTSELAENAGEARENADTGGGDNSGGDDSGGDDSGGDAAAADEGLSSEDWVLIVVLGVGALALIIFATSAATSHSQKKAAAGTERNRRLSEVAGGARWLQSAGTDDILGMTDPQQLGGAWSGVHQRFIDVEGQIAGVAGTTGDAGTDNALTYLGQSVAGLRGALQSYVSLRTDPGAAQDGAAAQQAAQTVSQCRQQLSGALGPVEQAMR